MTWKGPYYKASKLVDPAAENLWGHKMIRNEMSLTSYHQLFKGATYNGSIVIDKFETDDYVYIRTADGKVYRS